MDAFILAEPWRDYSQLVGAGSAASWKSRV